MGSSRNGASPSEGALCGEPGRMAPLLGTPKDMLCKALEMGDCFRSGLVLGNLGGRSFTGVFEKSEKFLYLGKFFMRNLRDMYKRACKRAALYKGALLGKLEGVRLLRLLREKENASLGSFTWTQRTLKVKSGGHLEL